MALGARSFDALGLAIVGLLRSWFLVSHRAIGELFVGETLLASHHFYVFHFHALYSFTAFLAFLLAGC